ncbi:MAG: HNH endonuclease [Nitrosarchaeum sp.]|nr:HNH endonuclease [Nitrosarchaeum sp.]
MGRTLTTAKKLKLLPLLIERDGFLCFYCKIKFKGNDYIYEHLNNNRADNRPENIVLAHQKCNIKKIENVGYILEAQWKLKENEETLFLGENSVRTDVGVPTEITISRECYGITNERITEIIKTHGKYEFKEALYDCIFQCREKTGNGSEQAIRRHILTLTASVANFEIIKKDKKKWIVKREK